MTGEELERLKGCLPKGFRLRRAPANSEGPSDVIFSSDLYLLQAVEGRRLLVFRRWGTFGYIQAPKDEEAKQELSLRNSEYEALLRQALVLARLDGKITLVIEPTGS